MVSFGFAALVSFAAYASTHSFAFAMLAFIIAFLFMELLVY